jgi:hypothetical protein
MKFRFARETLAASMDTVVDLAPTRKAIAAHCNAVSEDGAVTELTIRVEWRAAADPRIGWDAVYTVKNHRGDVLGFTDGPVQR